MSFSSRFNLFPVFLFILISFGTITAQNANLTAIEYNDFIVNQQNRIGAELIKFNDLINADTNLTNKAAVLNQLKLVSSTCTDAIGQVEKLRPFDNDFGLKKAAMDLLIFYESVFNLEYVEFVEILYSPQSNSQRMNELLLSVSDREQKLDAAFNKCQTDFSKFHNFSLRENELQQKIDNE